MASDQTLITLVGQVAAVQERVNAVITRMDDREKALREAMEATVRNAVLEAIEPLHKRVEAMEKKADRMMWMSTGASAVVGGIYWLAKALGIV